MSLRSIESEEEGPDEEQNSPTGTPGVFPRGCSPRTRKSEDRFLVSLPSSSRSSPGDERTEGGTSRWNSWTREGVSGSGESGVTNTG